MSKTNETSETVYEIRKAGRVWVRSTIPDCGYSAKELKSLRAMGFTLHRKEVEKDG